jgi:hypothetical protein
MQWRRRSACSRLPARPTRRRRSMHGLHHDEQAVVQRHAPAIQRVGLDRVDRAAWPAARDKVAGHPEDQPAERGHSQGAQDGQRDHGAQPLAGADPEQRLMDQLGERGHEPDHEPGEGADDSGERHQPDLVGPHQGAQEMRRVHHHVAERAAMPCTAGTIGADIIPGGTIGHAAVARRTRRCRALDWWVRGWGSGGRDCGEGRCGCRAHDHGVAFNARHVKRPARAGGARQTVINTRRRRSPREPAVYSCNRAAGRSTMHLAAVRHLPLI